MLNHHSDEHVKNGEPVRSSQLDLSQLHAAIKQTYFQLDQNLKNFVKDESGCVCVNILVKEGKERIFMSCQSSFRSHVSSVLNKFI